MSYDKGIPFKFWLNNKNLSYLTKPNSECDEDLYYSRRGKYIKSVLEEYSRLPYVQRELICFAPAASEIQEAIQKERQLRMERSKSAFLKESDKKRLAQAIVSRGVQFMVGDDEVVKVRLTDEGKHKYRRQTHLRPTLTEKCSENVFVFHCTAAQAEFYFFKFGKDAEILEPQHLRDKILSLYEKAAAAYIT